MKLLILKFVLGGGRGRWAARVCPISRGDRVVGHELSHRLCTSLKAETFSCPLNLFLTSNMYENTARSNNRQRLISPRHSFFSCALVWILVTCSCQQQ